MPNCVRTGGFRVGARQCSSPAAALGLATQGRSVGVGLGLHPRGTMNAATLRSRPLGDSTSQLEYRPQTGMQRGTHCKHGGAATQLLWNILLVGPMARLRQLWFARGVGVQWAPELADLELGPTNCSCSDRPGQNCKRHVDEIQLAFAEVGLGLSVWRQLVLRRTGQEFAKVATLRVRGIVLDADGSTEGMIAHRESEAWKVWHRHREVLCSSHVPPRERVAHLHQTVGGECALWCGHVDTE